MDGRGVKGGWVKREGMMGEKMGIGRWIMAEDIPVFLSSSSTFSRRAGPVHAPLDRPSPKALCVVRAYRDEKPP